jgi:hypothetical protein
LSGNLPSASLLSEFLFSAPIHDWDIFKALKLLKFSQSVDLDNISGFAIKRCSNIFVHLPKYTSNLSLLQLYFPTAWNKAAIFPVLKK